MFKIKRILCVVMIGFILVGCGNKEKITAEEFKTEMEESGLEVVDQTDSLEEQEYQKIYVAVKDKKYKIEYYLMDSGDSAKALYDYFKENLEKKYGNNKKAVILGSDFENQAHYQVSVSDYYYEVVRIEDTVLYATADSNEKKEVKSIIKELGY